MSSSSLPPAPSSGLKRWRQYRDFTQRQLAAAVGVHQTTISDWEHQRACPRMAHARALKRLLHAPSIDALFPADDDENGAAA